MCRSCFYEIIKFGANTFGIRNRMGMKVRKKYSIFFGVFILNAMIIYAQPEEILLEHKPLNDTRERPPVMFPHEKHMDSYACLDCHHRYKNGENILDEAELEDGNPAAQCMGCHDFETNCELQRIFHNQCLACHVQKGNERKGPRQCNGCHVPQKKGKIIHLK